ncbi:AEC family transporter [Pseudomonas sp. Marseille-QA0892]
MAALDAILPIFLLIVLGYGLCRANVLPADTAKGISLLAFKLFLPCVLLTGLADAPLREGFSPTLLLAYFVPALAVFIVTNIVVQRRFGVATSLGLAASYSNNVLIGIPLIGALFGDAGLIYTFSILTFHALTLFSFQSVYTAASGAGGFDKRALMQNLANPLLIGILIGLTINLTGITLPDSVDHVLHWMAKAALPCALIMLGMNLSTFKLKPSQTAVVLSVVKLVAMPAAVLLLCLAAGLNPLARAVLVLMAANPAGVNVLAFARTPDDVRINSSTVLVTTVVSVISLPAWMALLDWIG